MEKNKFLKRVEPFIAIGIFIMLLLSIIGLYKHISLQKEIKLNCGYKTTKYYCICHDSNSPEVLQYLNNKNNPQNINLSENWNGTP